MRNALGSLIAAAALALAPAAAHASSSDAVVRNAAPITNSGADVMVRGAVTVAVARWRARGHRVCPPAVFVADLGGGPTGIVHGLAATPGCWLAIDRSYRNSSWAIAMNSRMPIIGRRWALAELCGVVTHEVGHNLGFDHIPGTVMAAGTDQTVVPRECDAWAAEVLPGAAPRRHAAKRARR